MRLCFALLGCWLLLAGAPAKAQRADAMSWMVASAHLDIEDRWQIEYDGSLRFSNAQDGLYENLQMLYVTYAVNDDVSVSLGYQRNESAGKPDRTVENRLRQRISLPIMAIGRGELGFQLQMEQRFRNDGQDMQWRARPRLSLRMPFGERRRNALIISHESFISSPADWNRQVGWARMRNQVGARFPAGKDIRMEISYVNQYDATMVGRPHTMDHILQTRVIWAPSLRW